MADLPHKYHDYSMFTEPPVSADDTPPYPYAPVDLTTVRKQQAAKRQINAFQRGELELSTAEINALLDDLAYGELPPVNYWGLMEEEPMEPDALMALERTNWLATGVRSFGRTVFRRCNDVAAWLEGQAS